MCNCIARIEQATVARLEQANPYNRPVRAAIVKNTKLTIHDGLLTKTTTDLEITLSGKTHKPVETVEHTFCPFCGEKYGARHGC
ncbi:MAG: hypothetical protein KZQ99_04610 [Candidatus Thiodiazotropha sp. (ex Dulcina madagascariensis)]|nr:hypothetical protein [Candidatus Thiodiazotropha sp. (ex Dulcina madagascariensis)]